MSRLRDDLLRNPSAELVVSHALSCCRTEVLTAAEKLARSLIDARARRCLVQSADPTDLLVSLLACQDTSADLILAHAHLKPEYVERIGAQLGANTVLYPSQQRIRTLPVAGGQAEAHGRIFLMTSGTTGMPKVAEHAFDRLVGRIARSASVAANCQARWLLTYQPTTFAGMQVLLTACLTDGTIVEPTERTPAGFVHAAEHFGATHISGTPTFWRAFLLACDPVRLGQVKQITLGGEAIDQATLERLAKAFPSARITQIYASSEGGSLLAVSDGKPGFPAEWLDQDVQGVRLRIREGMLEVQSPRCMLGYQAEGQAEPTTADGWLVTGDLVRIEAKRVVFLGRSDTMINVGGAKVYPQEIENFLLTLPDIREARVKAVPNPITGQAIVAEIVIEPGRDAGAVRLVTVQACRQQLPRHQVPALVQIVPAIAVADSGKKLASPSL